MAARSWVVSLAPEGSPGSSRLWGLWGDGSPGGNVLTGSGWALGVAVCIVSGSERSDECALGGREKSELAVGHMCPGGRSGSNVLRLAPARRPSPLLSSVLGGWEPGPGLPVGQMDKVHEAPGRGGGGVGQLAGGFGVGEWQQGDILAGPAVAGDGAPLAMGVKASGLWVDLRAFSWAGSSSSRGCSSGFRWNWAARCCGCCGCCRA